ncbi:MAG: PAS domain-containing protein [Pseudomonadota bacterium]
MRRTRVMKADILSNLRDYWERLRKGRIAPYRAELDPRQFEDALEYMFILEQLNPNQLRVRLAGMALCDMMGMEVRGMPPEAFMASSHRSAFTTHINSVLTGPAVVELELVAVANDGQRTKGQMLLLPLRSDFGEVTRVLGCVITDEPIRQAPVNFSITSVRLIAIRRDGSTHEKPASTVPGFSEEQAPLLQSAEDRPSLRAIDGNPDAVRTSRRRGHLKVVGEDD